MCAGDWIGVVLNRVERTISFTKKGFDLGVAFEGVPPEERLFPSVGFRTPDEEVSEREGSPGCGGDVGGRPGLGLAGAEGEGAPGCGGDVRGWGCG